MIDTLSIARDLSNAGVDPKQAEAHATVIALAVEKQHGDVATKEFVRSEINATETRLIRWLVGTIFTATGITIASIVAFLAVIQS
ncbi:MAG: hypothetical protein OXI05_06755 [Bacteroidota bacterium]|nr:hypothetical protein [Bacteroidota bacterium]